MRVYLQDLETIFFSQLDFVCFFLSISDLYFYVGRCLSAESMTADDSWYSHKSAHASLFQGGRSRLPLSIGHWPMTGMTA
jgi:hypothetical protein